MRAPADLLKAYADHGEGHRALGSAWAGVLALLPMWAMASEYLPGGLREGMVDGIHRLLPWLPLAWVLGRLGLGRLVYRPFGAARPLAGTGGKGWNLGLVGLLLALGLGLGAAFLHGLLALGLPSGRMWAATGVPGLLLGLWLVQILWIGLRQVQGYEERLVLLWLGLLGVQHLFWYPTGGARALQVLLDPLAWGALLLAPILVVRGLREHRVFREIRARIAAPKEGA